MDSKDILLIEYSAICEHFRSYQSNRLNIVLFTFPAIGALMLACLQMSFILQMLSSVLLYSVLYTLVRIDNVFMRRLRFYSHRLSEIEKEGNVRGHATQRLANPNLATDATTNTIRAIIQVLNFTISLYFSTSILNYMWEHRPIGAFDASIDWYYIYGCLSILFWVPITAWMASFVYVKYYVNVERLLEREQKLFPQGS